MRSDVSEGSGGRDRDGARCDGGARCGRCLRRSSSCSCRRARIGGARGGGKGGASVAAAGGAAARCCHFRRRRAVAEVVGRWQPQCGAKGTGTRDFALANDCLDAAVDDADGVADAAVAPPTGRG